MEEKTPGTGEVGERESERENPPLMTAPHIPIRPKRAGKPNRVPRARVCRGHGKL